MKGLPSTKPTVLKTNIIPTTGTIVRSRTPLRSIGFLSAQMSKAVHPHIKAVSKTRIAYPISVIVV